jgi:hypothetical protein
MTENVSSFLNAETEHQLLRLLATATLSCSLLRKRLDRPEALNWDQTLELVMRIEQTQRAMTALLRQPTAT